MTHGHHDRQETEEADTRRSRERAPAAASANASLDLARAGKIALVVVVVAVLVLAVTLVVPRGSSLGGRSRRAGSRARDADGRPHQGPSGHLRAAGAVERERRHRRARGPRAARGGRGPDAEGRRGPARVRAAADREGLPAEGGVLEPFEDFLIPPGTSDVDGFQIVVGQRGRAPSPRSRWCTGWAGRPGTSRSSVTA